MNKKQKIAIACGFAVVIAMGLYPPWETWCTPMDHKSVQYDWILGPIKYPQCAEKLPWSWQMATDRLLVQWSLVLATTAAIAFILRTPQR